MAPTFLYAQLAHEIIHLIDKGTFQPGERLPSLRSLSENRQVSIATVSQAYLHLEAQGYLEARPQSGFYVCHRPPVLALPHSTSAPDAPAQVGKNAFISQILDESRRPGILPLGSTILDPSFLPVKHLSRLIARLAGSPENHTYVPTAGFEGLRRQIARRTLDSARPIGFQEVVITSGCMEALNLALRTLAQPGDLVAVESPTFYGILQAIESLGMRVLELPTDPSTGLDLDALEQALKQHPIRVLLSIPSFQNPLGTCMPVENKLRLLAIAARSGLQIIEDDIYGEFYFREPPPTLFSLDRQQSVLLCSSFSKTLAPGFRVGWALPGSHFETFLQLKRMTSLGTASLQQLVIAEYLASGAYERHLRRLRPQLERSLFQALQIISQHFPQGIRVSRPEGGFILWLELPPGTSVMDIYKQALSAGISIAPGPLFSNRELEYPALRLSLNLPWGERLEQALYQLGAILRQNMCH
ncbi:MAG: PLP-dependent aminotransferase family protein [Candidatus Sericytochromatia bacterium]